MQLSTLSCRILSAAAILLASTSLVLAADHAAAGHAGSDQQMNGSHAKASAMVTTGSPIELAYSAAGVLKAQMHTPKKERIPTSLLAGAHCIGVFPTVFKEGFIAAGKHGDGIISCRSQSGGWDQAAPAFYSLSGGSIGFQAGAKVTQVVLLFMGNNAAQQLKSGSIKVGANITGTAGPTGANAGIHTAPAGVIAYQLRNSGVFAGVEVKGSKLSPNEDVNQSLYGNDANPEGLLSGQAQIPEGLQIFSKALSNYAPASKYNPDMQVKNSKKNGNDES